MPFLRLLTLRYCLVTLCISLTATGPLSLGVGVSCSLVLGEALMGQLCLEIPDRVPGFGQRPLRLLSHGRFGAQSLAGSIQLIGDALAALDRTDNGNGYFAIAEKGRRWGCERSIDGVALASGGVSRSSPRARRIWSSVARKRASAGMSDIAVRIPRPPTMWRVANI
jgi:hypothetical protein